MHLMRISCYAAVLALLVTPSARGDEWNKLTYFTFSGPVEVPGTTLPAGTYMFKIADGASNRHVVQIFSKDGKKLYKTILAIPNQRLEPSDTPIMMFAERAAGTPQAVKAWFYPGRTVGDEFVYPRQQAIAIAKATHESVLSTSSASDAALKTAKAEWVNAEGEVVGEHGALPTPQPQIAQPADTTAGTSGRTATNEAATHTAHSNRRELPRTASPLALVELLSGLSFAGAFGVRQLRKRMAL
jgi:hypothetical protein